jgi:Ni/Co efflux regulator RcnB
MRKLLMSLLIATAITTPAVAQRGDDRGRGGGRENRVEQRTPEQRQQVQRALEERRGNGTAPARVQRRADALAERGRANMAAQERRDVVRQNRQGERADFRRERRDDRQDFRRERRDDRRDWQNGQYDNRRDYRQDRREDRRDYRADRRDDRRDFRNDNRRWDRDWRRDQRYDWQRYRDRNRNVYRLPRYYAPRGYNYGYRRYGIGLTLSSLLYGSNYWINDPWQYRLPPAYGGTRWIRYYDDVLLVDTRSGYVIDVIYDFFY